MNQMCCFILSHPVLNFMANKLHKKLKHVAAGGTPRQGTHRLQIRSQQGKWDRKKQAGK